MAWPADGVGRVGRGRNKSACIGERRKKNRHINIDIYNFIQRGNIDRRTVANNLAANACVCDTTDKNKFSFNALRLTQCKT